MADPKPKTLSYEELRKFDGKGPTGKIYVALCGKVYDVTEKGQQFYGEGAPYQAFAGRDASRGLATMAMKFKDTKDDLSDLTEIQQRSLKSWEVTFSGGPYQVFAGNDATLGLACFKLTPQEAPCDVTTLSDRHREHAEKWLELFQEKYVFVAELEIPKPLPATPEPKKRSSLCHLL